MQSGQSGVIASEAAECDVARCGETESAFAFVR